MTEINQEFPKWTTDKLFVTLSLKPSWSYYEFEKEFGLSVNDLTDFCDLFCTCDHQVHIYSDATKSDLEHFATFLNEQEATSQIKTNSFSNQEPFWGGYEETTYEIKEWGDLFRNVIDQKDDNLFKIIKHCRKCKKALSTSHYFTNEELFSHFFFFSCFFSKINWKISQNKLEKVDLKFLLDIINLFYFSYFLALFLSN